MALSNSKIAVIVVLSLTICLLIPDLSNQTLISEMSFRVLKNISGSGFYLMLSLFSFIWSYFAYKHGTGAFNFLTLLKLILCFPLFIFICVVSYYIAIVFLTNSPSALNLISNVAAFLYKFLDLIIISFFLALVYKTLTKKLSLKIKTEFSKINFAGSLAVALIFMLFIVMDFNVCSSSECRQTDLKSALGDDVYLTVEKYVKSSPVILKDTGEINKISNQAGQQVHVAVWLDYDANMNLEVEGEKGLGSLELMIAGNNYKSIEIFQGTWKFNGNSTPIGNEGTADYSRVKSELLAKREKQLQALIDADNCQEILALLATNQEEEKQQMAYSLDHIKVSFAKASCLEKLGQNEAAAEEFASYAFFSSPFPFQEKPEDLKKIEKARNALHKAMKLNVNSKSYISWQSSLEKLDIQEKLTSNPCDETLRNQLRENLDKNHVHYSNLPACHPADISK